MELAKTIAFAYYRPDETGPVGVRLLHRAAREEVCNLDCKAGRVLFQAGLAVCMRPGNLESSPMV